MNLYNVLGDELRSTQIRNKGFYKKGGAPWMAIEQYEQLEKELDMTSDETSCIIEEYINGLAGHTSFYIINKDGYIVR